MSNSNLVTYKKISPNRNSPRNHIIDTITPHCFVGQVTAEQGCNIKKFTNYDPNNGASCNYVIGFDGSIGLCVEECDRAWTSSNRENDHRAVTIEVASDTFSPYRITDMALNSLIKLCADICQRNNINKLKFSDDKQERVKHLNGVNITCHRDFDAKECPGQYIYERLFYIADEVNKLLDKNEPTNNNKEYIEYVVVKGDNLTKIARKYNTTVNELVKINNIKNKDLIYIDQKLLIPRIDGGD